MSNRLALIVDDSRSARHILSRMLESFGLEVASVESAELALTYLQGARPDVIFMDHLMPGMDGFAAVRVLKSNPDTVTIPVLMYTSQEGEMYLSQARALGAMGVLPKTLKHADVAEALQHLNLLPPEKAGATTTATAAPVPRAAAAPVPPIEIQPVQMPASAHEERASQTGSHLAIPQLAHRIAAEVRDDLQQVTTRVSRRLNFWRALAALSGVASAILLALLLFLQYQTRQQLQQIQGQQQQLQLLLNQQATSASSASFTAALNTVDNTMAIASDALPVAYGEVPLSGARLDYLRDLHARYNLDPRQLVIRVESFMGDFCLARNASGAYEPAADEVLQVNCDLTGNPFGDALSVQQRQSVAFANLLASINSANSNTGSHIKVQLVEGGHQTTTPYPVRSATLTAGDWNRVAERNQVVKFTVQEAF